MEYIKHKKYCVASETRRERVVLHAYQNHKEKKQGSCLVVS